MLETAAGYLTKAPSRKDVKAVFAGLRPLARPKEGSTKTKEISRSHKVIVSESKLVTLTGGKWTTYRKMGEDTVEHFPEISGELLVPSQSFEMKLHGYTERVPEGHWSVYGSDAKEIKGLAKSDPALSEKIHTDFPNLMAEVLWAVKNEMAVRVEDVLSRRIRMLILDAQAALDSAEKVARLMAKELQKDENWIQEELIAFKKVAEKYLIKA